ncbi:helix-turn-helix domain-containing protein [Pseudemcibacter aquimaris]|uniref:helix-turn-helix domain-containing protein n=1 Tax=Pseudemcibacter aquimaris TaxID=2857064 RepID=UPI002011566E|nr:helix-turn-helix domain-containing protein [Pseudemcibacter aquimaris]MCC3862432.1 helix-turn-helix domain-containing protein [Pseudemcibacter aquimaris]WDU59139.1 helix-turn-helix domain-containing protein [Pseudemcibacter aquimaris]
MIYSLNYVNLIQAGMITTGIMGAILLWLSKPNEFRGIALTFAMIAIASLINILEETGLTRDYYLISPIFIMLFGPAIFLSVKLIIDKKIEQKAYWHFFPALPLLMMTSYTSTVIAIGTLWRLAYAFLTVWTLINYKKELDEQRSDSDDHSLNWLVWILVITALFNFIDLVRLNTQHLLPYALNVIGQAVNNAIWLIISMIIIIKLQLQQSTPVIEDLFKPKEEKNTSEADDYQTLFTELDHLVQKNNWFLEPRISLSDISHKTGLNIRDISRAINLVTKKSYNEYINQYRVDFVCQKIKDNPNQSILDIAFEAGFSSKASFNKVFKELTGTTPSQYKSSLLS